MVSRRRRLRAPSWGPRRDWPNRMWFVAGSSLASGEMGFPPLIVPSRPPLARLTRQRKGRVAISIPNLARLESGVKREFAELHWVPPRCSATVKSRRSWERTCGGARLRIRVVHTTKVAPQGSVQVWCEPRCREGAAPRERSRSMMSFHVRSGGMAPPGRAVAGERGLPIVGSVWRRQVRW